MDTNELTIAGLKEALRDRVSELTENYETKIVILRVELTQAHERIDALNNELEGYRQAAQEREYVREDAPDAADTDA
jgi:hypothetical protein